MYYELVQDHGMLRSASEIARQKGFELDPVNDAAYDAYWKVLWRAGIHDDTLIWEHFQNGIPAEWVIEFETREDGRFAPKPGMGSWQEVPARQIAQLIANERLAMAINRPSSAITIINGT